MHWSLFNDTHLVWLEALTTLVNNPINNFLINPNIILYHVFLYHIFLYQIFMNIDDITGINNIIINRKIVEIYI